MNRNKIIGCALIAALGAWANAGAVRTISMNSERMEEIHLSMGRSTVLHFIEKPTKVIVGNANYFHVEFTSEDVTIQPLGNVTSNMFVYSDYNRYGFILSVKDYAYDDLVNVKWRSKPVADIAEVFKPTEKSQPVKPVIPSKKGAPVEFKLVKVIGDTQKKITIIELGITNNLNRRIALESIAFKVSCKRNPLPVKTSVYAKDLLERKGESVRGRLFVDLCDVKFLSVEADLEGNRYRINQ